MLAALFLLINLLGDTVQTNGTPSLPPTKPNTFTPFKKKEKVIKGVLDQPGTAFGELKFKKYF